jgi:tetratricopeptide (TPR) repeat protein
MRFKVLAAVLAAFFLSSLSSAQSQLPAAKEAGPAVTAGYTVSVRELKIPGKARKAFDKGMRMVAERNSAGSVVEFQKAIAAYPAYYEAYYRLGATQLDLERGTEATEAFLKAIELSEGHYAPPYFALALVFCHDNRFAEADTLAKTALSLEPDASIGQFALGWAELGLGRLATAEKAIRTTLERKADFREGWLLLIEIHRRGSHLPELVQDVDAYLKLDASGAPTGPLRKLREEAQRTMAQADDKTTVMAATQP